MNLGRIILQENSLIVIQMEIKEFHHDSLSKMLTYYFKQQGQIKSVM